MTELYIRLTQLHASYEQDHACALSARKKLRTACHIKIQRQPLYKPTLHNGVSGVVNVLICVVSAMVGNSMTIL